MRPVEKVRIVKIEGIKGGTVVLTRYCVEYVREKNLFQRLIYAIFGYESWKRGDPHLSFWDFRDASVCAHTLRGKKIIRGTHSTIL